MPSYPKTPAYRNEDLRRAVAGLPCVHCGHEGHTQAAHVGGLAEGKGGALKVSDARIAALCTVHLLPSGHLIQGCHEKFDQHKLGPGLEAMLVADTYIALMETGRLRVVR